MNDPGETQDLSVVQAKLFQELLTAYAQYAKENRVLEMAPDYDMALEMQRKFKVKIMWQILPYLIGSLALIIGIFAWWRRRI